MSSVKVIYRKGCPTCGVPDVLLSDIELKDVERHLQINQLKKAIGNVGQDNKKTIKGISGTTSKR